MPKDYPDVTTRFLRPEERLMLSDAQDMPLVLEASGSTDLPFLNSFLKTHSAQLLEDIATHGAVLLRGFDVATDADFENAILSIQGFEGISEALMSEEGRIHVGDLKYILYTNAVYKTGGTVYLGGFHSENYYSPDVPSYICFACMTPSTQGGETGLVNMEKVYAQLSQTLKDKLEKKSFFVMKWLISEVAERYQVSPMAVEKICAQFDLPMVGHGDDKLVLMYKPSVMEHPLTKQKSLFMNLFEVANLNEEMRRCFAADYQGSAWFWHRVFWKLPLLFAKVLERVYVSLTSFFYSPRQAMGILLTKWKVRRATHKKSKLPLFDDERVGSCFTDDDVKDLAKLIRQHYSSCLWKKGDILLVDNRKVMHAGMPGSGPRVVRALIGNPLDMGYSSSQPGMIEGHLRTGGTIGAKMNGVI
ncbi:MAG: TauD/TfdA family dioxygenase [Gammaproteobacteria bacterium]|nr:TauD/TfdA family dioxygenase [Gammaproteobacteria bacterium]